MISTKNHRSHEDCIMFGNINRRTSPGLTPGQHKTPIGSVVSGVPVSGSEELFVHSDFLAPHGSLKR